jgi:hypothetical protein
MTGSSGRRSPQIAAAVWWLSTAPSRIASRAAVSGPSGTGAAWPTAKTPRCSRRNLPAVTARSIAFEPIPAAVSCRRAARPR